MKCIHAEQLNWPRRGELLKDPDNAWEKCQEPISILVHGVFQSNDGSGEHFPVVAVELPDGRLWSMYVGAGDMIRLLPQDETER